jgi:uncharacterized phage protein gp47/JayE
LLTEKLTAAKVLFGDDIDLTSGSAIRKILEIMAMEESRCWEHIGRGYEDTFIATAQGQALSMLGAELGFPRPHYRATGTVKVSLATDLPAGTTSLVLDRGLRLLTDGGHDYFNLQRTVLTNNKRSADLSVQAFHPGPEHNLDPTLETGGAFPQKLNAFNPDDGKAATIRSLATTLGQAPLTLEHTLKTTGGETYWDDESYRDLLLSYPRNLWSAEGIERMVARIPGVRQVIIKDRYGGLDINQAIFGNFNFIERLFSEERSLGSPYYLTILVAEDVGAIWNGPGQLAERIKKTVDEIRPIGIFPNIEQAQMIGIGLQCSLTVEGLPIPSGSTSAVNQSTEAIALKQRIIERIRRYINHLRIGEPVRYSEILWSIMEEPGVVDCTELRLRRYPPSFDSLDLQDTGVLPDIEVLAETESIDPGPKEVPVLVEDPSYMVIV